MGDCPCACDALAHAPRDVASILKGCPPHGLPRWMANFTTLSTAELE